jgi:hypothetical protein
MGDEGRSGGTRSLELTEAVNDAYQRADWPALRALYHDDALLSPIAAQHEIVNPDALVRLLAHVTSETVYEIDGTETIAIDDHAALVTGRIRFPLPAGGFGEGQRTWLLTYKDDLLYRTCAFTSPAKARAAYAEHGLDLGIFNEVRASQLDAAREATAGKPA